MKMLKKVAAIALAGVLALSVLTGCGSKNSTGTVVDGLNDVAKLGDGQVTYVADSQMDEKVATIAKTVVEKAGDTKLTGKSTYQIIGELQKNSDLVTALKPLTTFDKAVVDDETKPLYSISIVEIGQSFNIADGKNAYYAMSLVLDAVEINKPDTWGWEEKGTSKVGTATCTIGGKEYMVALFQCPIVKVANENN